MKQLSLTMAALAVVCSMTLGQVDPLLLRQKNLPLPTLALLPDAATLPEGEAFSGFYYRIWSFNTLPNEARKEQLRTAGVTWVAYLPSNSFLVKYPQHFRPSNWGIQQEMPVYSIFKIDQSLLSLMDSEPPITIRVAGFPGLSVSEVAAALQAEGYSGHSGPQWVELTIPPAAIALLAKLPFVYYLEATPPPPKPDGLGSRNLLGVSPLGLRGNSSLTGEGVRVAIGDDGPVNHIDLKGRIIDQTTRQNSGRHASMVAGMFGGAGNLDPFAKGIAPGAEIYLYDIQEYAHIWEAPSHLVQDKVTLTSTSYGDGCGGFYSLSALTLDDQVWRNPQLLHIFSAGNLANSNCSPMYSGIKGTDGLFWGNITGGLKTAKNALVIGNIDGNSQLQDRSSRGPLHDGRIKPDLVALGQDDWTTDQDNAYRYSGGTSAAAPVVAGIAALLTERYRQINGQADPTSDLLRGLLLNSAQDLGRKGPDFEFGWGKADASAAVQILEAKQYRQASLATNESITYSIQVPANTPELRVMITWNDVAGSPLSAAALVNDLDLTVVDPSGKKYYPWVLSTATHYDSLTRPAHPGVDRINNVEQVAISFPATGKYSLQVKAFQTPAGKQPFTLTYYWESPLLELRQPAAGQSIPAQSTLRLRWAAHTNSATSYTLEYAQGAPNNWKTITSNVPANTESLDWVLPPELMGVYFFRVRQGNVTSTVSGPITILDIPRPEIHQTGDNQAELTWQSVNGATSYEVLQMGEKYMTPIGTTSTLSWPLTDLVSGQEYWFAVRALPNNSSSGPRSNAISYIHKTCIETISLGVKLDFYPTETSWEIRDAAGQVVLKGGPYKNLAPHSAFTVSDCLPAGCFQFVVYDGFGDGICCQAGTGYLQLANSRGEVLASVSRFGKEISLPFCIEGGAPSTSALVASIAPLQEISCYESQDGVLMAAATGGTGTYQYLWSTGAKTSTISNLTSGFYSVTISDGTQQQQAQYELKAPSPLALKFSSTPLTCAGSRNGQLNVQASGGNTPYQYQWANGTTTDRLVNIPAGWYGLTITDARNCQTSGYSYVTEPTPLWVSLATTPENSSIQATVSGGTSPYLYRWSDGGSSSNRSGLPPGAYGLTVTDAKGCTRTSTTTLAAPPSSTKQEPYCQATARQALYEWIESVQIGSYLRKSGKGNGYNDFTTETWSFTWGSTSTFRIEAGFLGVNYNENWYVWLDANGDGDFTDPGELLLRAEPGSSVVSGNWTWPMGTGTLKTRLRVAIKFLKSDNPCGDTPYGEIEDYTIQLGPPAAVATLPVAPTLGASTGLQALWKVFPNPTSGWTTISWENDTGQAPQHFRLLNSAGQIVWESKTEAGYQPMQLTVNWQALPAGIYHLRWGDEVKRIAIHPSSHTPY